jgi:glutathione S-transferase
LDRSLGALYGPVSTSYDVSITTSDKGLPMLALYYYPGNASLLPHMMLREIGAEFELRLVDRGQNAQKSSEYLKLNPNGRIPVLIDGDLVLFETAAIALHLADRFPQAGLAPEVGTAERAEFYRWIAHLTNTPPPSSRQRASASTACST